MALLEAKRLTKTFGGLTAVDQVDSRIEFAEISRQDGRGDKMGERFHVQMAQWHERYFLQRYKVQNGCRRGILLFLGPPLDD